MSDKVYTLSCGRPIGMIPKIYYNKPDLCECGGGNCNPWCPSLEEFQNEFIARRYFKLYYPSLYQELEIIK